ncbi:MAG: Lar family restriction alleviation protein [Synergistaceae bacterium]|nr:Lar family restriction alleviation protein [Synergistaceae bacterium]
MDEELKPCPFCGSIPEVCEAENDGELLKMVACLNCGVSTFASEDEAKVIEAWNRRV